MRVKFLPGNRYRRLSPESIVYNVRKTDRGWTLEAKIPKRLSADDKVTLINWFDSYRTTVRKMHPHWLTRFYSSGEGYFLDVDPVRSPKEVVEHGQDLKAIWTDEVANRA
jgi:hypothetical protein